MRLTTSQNMLFNEFRKLESGTFFDFSKNEATVVQQLVQKGVMEYSEDKNAVRIKVNK